MEALTNYYTTHNEDARLTPKRGMVEFLTTIHYVEKYLKPGMRILEIGAGTGRYSHYFAQNGYAVDAVELMECNIEVFKTNTKDGENNILKHNAFAVFLFRNPANPVRVHLQVGNGLLRGMRFPVALCLPYKGGNLFLFGAG